MKCTLSSREKCIVLLSLIDLFSRHPWSLGFKKSETLSNTRTCLSVCYLKVYENYLSYEVRKLLVTTDRTLVE